MSLNKLKNTSNIIQKLFIITLTLSLVFVSSCKKDTLSNGNGLSNKEILLEKPLNLKITNAHVDLTSNLEPFKNLSPTDIQNLTESQAEDLLEPLVNAGSLLYSDLIALITETPEWSELTSEEQSVILNFTPQQKAMLELLFSSASKGDLSGMPKWVSCGTAALGFEQAYSLLTRAFSVGMSATTAIQVLKFVGLRYLGYLSLAIAVYQFVDCLSYEVELPIDPGDESLSGPGGTLYPIELESYLMPLHTGQYGYKVYASHLTDGYGHQAYFTSLYFNPSDNRYYADINLTSFVPNGYYLRHKLGQYQQYYRIVDGVSIMLYELRP